MEASKGCDWSRVFSGLGPYYTVLLENQKSSFKGAILDCQG